MPDSEALRDSVNALKTALELIQRQVILIKWVLSIILSQTTIFMVILWLASVRTYWDIPRFGYVLMISMLLLSNLGVMLLTIFIARRGNP